MSGGETPVVVEIPVALPVRTATDSLPVWAISDSDQPSGSALVFVRADTAVHAALAYWPDDRFTLDYAHGGATVHDTRPRTMTRVRHTGGGYQGRGTVEHHETLRAGRVVGYVRRELDLASLAADEQPRWWMGGQDFSEPVTWRTAR